MQDSIREGRLRMLHVKIDLKQTNLEVELSTKDLL